MALITDVNTDGNSGLLIKAQSNLFEVVIGGTWNSATVALQRKISNDSWITVHEFTDNVQQIVESVGSGTYRTTTTVPGTAPVLECDVIFPSGQLGRVEAA